MEKPQSTPASPTESTGPLSSSVGGLSTATASASTVESTSPSTLEDGGDGGEAKDDRRFSTASNASSIMSTGLIDYAGNLGGADDSLKDASSSLIRFYPKWCRCFSFLERKTNYNPHSSRSQRVISSFLCPPQGPLARLFTFILISVLAWVFVYLLLMTDNHRWDQKTAAAPNGPIFALIIIEVLGLFAGIGMKLIGLPSLLGPLIMGILMKNVKPLNIFVCFEPWDKRACGKNDKACNEAAVHAVGLWIKPIRQIALTMILTRAGLELSPKQLKKLKGAVPLLAFGPCLMEAFTCAGLTYLAFHTFKEQPMGISVTMCLVAGFALAAVSPAVVVPGMLSLKKKGYGVAQGIPVLLIAASSIDDVLAISAYSVFLSLALSTGHGSSQWKTYVALPIGIIVGLVHGFIAGVLLHFVPARDRKHKASIRLTFLLLLNLVSMFAYEDEELLSIAASLSVLCTSFIASFGWRSFPHWKKPMKTIEKRMGLIWALCVPLLFGTIGQEMDFSSSGFTKTRVLKIFGIIFLSLAIRCTTAFLIARTVRLRWKECLFCALAWIPKATVQATLAPLVLSQIQASSNPEIKKLESHGHVVVTTAILAILITAPLGSVLIAFFGPKLLRLPTYPEKHSIEEEFPNEPEVPEGLSQVPSSPFIPKQWLKAASVASIHNRRPSQAETEDQEQNKASDQTVVNVTPPKDKKEDKRDNNVNKNKSMLEFDWFEI